MPNENVLEGMLCPRCKSEGPFKIHGNAMFLVYDDGCDSFELLSWEDSDVAECAECGYIGRVRDFREPKTKHKIVAFVTRRYTMDIAEDTLEKAMQQAKYGDHDIEAEWEEDSDFYYVEFTS